MPVPSVLVLGATGQTGGAVVDHLLGEHRAGRLRIIAATRRAAAGATLADKGIEVRVVDLDSAERHGLDSVIGVMEGVNRVFLVSGYDVRMMAQAKAAIDAARLTGVEHLVHLGVHAATDTTIVHFAWHQLIEAYIERSGLGYTHLHPTSFMQNLLMPVITDPQMAMLTHFIDNARTSWVDTDDIAALAAAVLSSPTAHNGQRYGLGTETASMDEIASIVSEVTGRPWRYQPRKPEDFFRAVTEAGADPLYMACVRNVFERTAEGSVPEATATFDSVERVTGRKPASLHDFIERHRQYFLTDAPAGH